MNDNTKPTGVIVPLYSSGGGGRDSPVEPMSTSYGPRSKPCLRIVAWWNPEAPSIAPTDNDPGNPAA